jgi:Flp pilus assembly protein TadG
MQRPSLMRRSRHRSHGQSLAEFAIVFPILMLIIGGIIQFALILWAQNTLTQVIRDTGRWAATQQAVPCSGVAGLPATANQIALNSSLIGYVANQWKTASYVTYADNASLPATPPSATGLEAVWSQNPKVPVKPCPPPDNTTVWYVTIRGATRAPIFFPWIPGNGDLSSTAQFRMEPTP